MKRLAALLLLAAAVWYGFYMTDPPAPKPADAPETEYSALRAFEHVKALSQAPHPMGTDEHGRVRNYIMQELRGLGLEPEIHEGITSGSFYGGAAHVRNILARIPGSDPAKTILLMAHYDTVTNAPGASDDGSGVAAILETIRALQAGEAPRNNVMVLITDGEEVGLLGAEYFMNSHPAADSVDLVLNLEARGSSGASFMFETSSPNRSLIPGFARSASHPVANSLTYTVYKMMPNDTDLSVTKDAGLAGFNFAYAEDHLDYHTMQDTPANMSLASLQHHGENLLPVVRHFANTDFDLRAEGEMVYFNNLSGGLSHYPASWSLPLALAALLLFAGWLVYLFRTGRLGWGRWLGSLLIFMLTVAAGALVTWLGFRGMAALHPEYRWLAHGEVYPHTWYLAAFSALMLALIAPTFAWMQRRWDMEAPLSGVYTVWITLGTVVAWYLPTASYLFTWPALLGLVGWIVLGDRITERSWRTLGLLFLGLLAALFMVPIYIQQVQMMMTTRMLWVSMVVLLLLAGLAWPWMHYIGGGQMKKWSGGLLLLALACLAGASLNSGFDESHKKHNHLIYLADLGAGEAHWVSRDHAVDSRGPASSWVRIPPGSPSRAARGCGAAIPCTRRRILSTSRAPSPSTCAATAWLTPCVTWNSPSACPAATACSCSGATGTACGTCA
ncbi:MAG: M20/M25/M40 family metallo-hydrolase [Balneolaceae bacterium]|nr:M20/M25/M40 family metallo-hydrolase [Balneolaceae bacterium]